MAGLSIRDIRPASGGDFRPGAFVAALLLLFALMAALSSCRSARYVPVETVRTDSVVRIVRDTVLVDIRAARLDSFFVRDTIYIKEYVREVVDTAGRVVRTDRERETVRSREAERYAALFSDYRALEREYEALNAAYLARQSVPVKTEREPARRTKSEVFLRWLPWVILSAVAVWKLRRIFR